MNNFSEKIKKWIELDTTINKHSEYIKQLKQRRSDIEQELEFFFKNNRSDELKLSNGKSICYQQNKVTPTISLKLLTEVLSKTLDDKNSIETILSNLKKTRSNETKYTFSIKYKNTK